MVKLIARIFIKDYQNTSSENVRSAYGILASLFGMITNLILFLMKLVVGILVSSVSIIADAINNFSDFANSLMVLLGFNVAKKPADSEHPFGHERVEYVIGLVVAIIIIAVGLNLLKESIQSMFNASSAIFQIYGVIILSISIGIKLIQSYFYFSTGKLISSNTLKNSAFDSLFDVIATTAVLLGMIFGKYVPFSLDGLLGIFVSLLIIYNSFGFIKDSVSPLISQSIDPKLKNQIIDEINSYKGVIGVHDVLAHIYGPNIIYMSAHVEVDSRNNLLDVHEVIDQIEHDIKKKYNISLMIHIDPVEVNDPTRQKYCELVQSVLDELKSDLTFHDLRLVKTKKRTKLIFEIAVPFSYRYTDEEIIFFLKMKIKEKDPKIQIQIEIDKY